jgi:hypothetical protein
MRTLFNYLRYDVMSNGSVICELFIGKGVE